MITGFRYAAHMIQDGKWKKWIHCFPTSAAVNLNWLSPELLEQVSVIKVRYHDLQGIDVFVDFLDVRWV